MKCTRQGSKRKKKREGKLHQWSPEIRGWSPKWLDPPMLARRCSQQLSKSTTSFFKVSIRVSIASTAGWTFFMKKARAISWRWSRMNSIAKPTLINFWTAALHYKIFSEETVSTKLCPISFITLPSSFKKCSLVERPRKNPCMKSP